MTWDTKCNCVRAINIWQFKLRLLRKKIKGWDINVGAAMKRKTKDLLQEHDILDIFRSKTN